MLKNLVNLIRRTLFATRVFGKNLSLNDMRKLTAYFFNKIVLRRSVPLSAVFAITYRCQCSCIHCSVNNYQHKLQTELNTEEVKKVLFSLNTLGIFKVTLFGGEPLLRDDILEIIAYARKIRLRLSIDTNGMLLDRSLLEKFKYLKISNVNVSLDSADRDTHDKLRNRLCFDNAIRGIKACVELGIPCLVSTYASRRSIESGDLGNLIRLAKDLKVSGVKILLPILSGNWINQKEEKLTLAEEIKVRQLLDPCFVYIEDALSMVRNASRKCSALDKNFFYITPDGTVQLCPAIPVAFGNIRDTKLENILRFMWGHAISRSEEGGCLMNNESFRKRFGQIFEATMLPVDASQLQKKP